MRPCPRCRAPLQNRDATCPHCGAAESAPPKPNSDPLPKPSRGERIRSFFGLVIDLGLLGAAGLVVFVGLFGAVGFLLAGKFGAGFGVAAAIALLVGLAIRGEGE